MLSQYPKIFAISCCKPKSMKFNFVCHVQMSKYVHIYIIYIYTNLKMAYVICHNWKVPGKNFFLLIFRTCRFIFNVELSSLWTVNNTIFCLFRFLYICYGQQITQYFVSYFILHRLGTANNTAFFLFCFLSSPLRCSKN